MFRAVFFIKPDKKVVCSNDNLLAYENRTTNTTGSFAADQSAIFIPTSDGESLWQVGQKDPADSPEVTLVKRVNFAGAQLEDFHNLQHKLKEGTVWKTRHAFQVS